MPSSTGGVATVPLMRLQEGEGTREDGAASAAVAKMIMSESFIVASSSSDCFAQ
jgi:hypothetical protein